MTLSIITLIAIFILLKWLEFRRPLRQSTRPWQQRLIINLSIAAIVFTTAFFTIKPASQFMMDWTLHSNVGVLHWLSLPFAAQLIVGFLLMDLSFYYWHRVNHVFPLLWRFHNMHHIDPDLDVSTSFRFHFVEIAYSVIFRVAQLSLIGINPLAFIFYEYCFQACTLFQHSNVRLPITTERWLNKVFVTPRMHGIHHSQVMDETNANYSVIFSFWDRLHNTLRLNIPQQEITIGVPAYTQASDNQLVNLLKLPFSKQRHYWAKEYSGKLSRDKLPENKLSLLE